MPFVYLLTCRDGSLYAGAAVDLERRFREHCAGRASRYTRARLPVVIAWSMEVESWSAALREEARIKGLDRAAKLALVEAAVRKAKRRRRATAKLEHSETTAKPEHSETTAKPERRLAKAKPERQIARRAPRAPDR